MFQRRILLTLVLTTAVLVHAAEGLGAMRLSDRLPKDYVDQLIQQKHWQMAFDDPKSIVGKDMERFWALINQLPEPDQMGNLPEKIVDELFGLLTNPVASPREQAEALTASLYPVKFLLLRYIRESEDRAVRDLKARIQPVLETWQRRYIDLALGLIEVAEIPGASATIENFRHQLRTGSVTIADLSPSERTRIRAQIHHSHGTRLEATLPSDPGRYLVAGVYNDERKYLGLDFARPVEETIITFTHEIFHAAHPELERNRALYVQLYPRVLDIVKRWTGGMSQASWAKFAHEMDVLGLMSPAFDEAQEDENLSPSLAERSFSIRQERQTQLDTQSRELIAKLKKKNPEFQAPTAEEIQVIRQWMDTVLDLSVMNEYRARGMGVVLYSVLKDRLRMIMPDPERQKTLEQYLPGHGSGDEVIALYLSLDANPMPKLTKVLFESLRDFAVPDEEATFKVQIAAYLLEAAYLSQANTLLNGLKEARPFGSQIAMIQAEAGPDTEIPEEDREIAPEWTKPGKYSIPSNRHTLMRAAPTTAWVLAFKRHLEVISDDLKKIAYPLVTQRIGVLDLDGLSLDDLILVGIHYQGSSYAKIPDPSTPEGRAVHACIESNIDPFATKEKLEKYFDIVKWKHDLKDDEKIIGAEEVVQKLIALRMIRADLRLNTMYPYLKTDIVAIRVLLAKLNEKRYASPNEISPERKLQLERELEIMRDAVLPQIRNEILKLQLLFKSLTEIYQMGSHLKLKTLDRSMKFLENGRKLLKNLDTLGVAIGQSAAEGHVSMIQQSNELRKQLEPLRAHCAEQDENEMIPILYEVLKKEPIRLRIENQDFPILLRCYRSKLYAVRQPCPDVPFMSAMTHGTGASEKYAGRIFFASRAVELLPLRLSNESEVYVEPAQPMKPKRKSLLRFLRTGSFR